MRRHVVAVLEETGWRVSGGCGAAGILGLKGTALEARMKRLGIARPARSPPFRWQAPNRSASTRARRFA